MQGPNQLKILNPARLRPKVGVVVGTRPGIIKMSPIIRVLQNQNLDFFLMHTGQHYSYEMDAQFFGTSHCLSQPIN